MKFIAMSTLLVIAILLSSLGKGVAQGIWAYHFGIAVPMSDFASDDLLDEKAGGASLGLNAGLKYVYPINENGLGIYGGVDVNYNPLQEDVKKGIEETFESMGAPDADYVFYTFINIPLSAGLHYSYKADEKLTLFGKAGVSCNFLKATDFQIKVGWEKVVTTFDLATGFGYNIGGGIIIKKKAIIAVNYMALGKHDIDATMTASGANEDLDMEQDVQLLTLSIGFYFN